MCSLVHSLRQYPLYNKTSPPDVLKGHFDQETFEKSQRYGKAKAKFSFASGIYRQVLESALLYFDFYPWAWNTAESLVAKVGYGGQVCRNAHKVAVRSGHSTCVSDHPIHLFRWHSVLCFRYSSTSIERVPNFCS
jgi:hypothetical protein